MVQLKKLDALLVYVESEPFTWTFSRRPQLGLYFLAQYAVDAGYKVLVDNLSANDHVAKRINRLMRKHNCSLLGLYVDHDNQWPLRGILISLHKMNPEIKVIIGGPQVTSAPVNTMDRLPQAICGSMGEGEETFLEMLKMPELNESTLQNCNGLIIRSKNEYKFTEPRKPIENIDNISIPLRKELGIDKSYSFIPTMLTGRGCTGRCAFCFEGKKNTTGKRLRLNSAQRCIDEFDYLAKSIKKGYICILDDTFVADTKRLKEFCTALITKHKGKVKWFCEARVDTLVRNPEILPMMIEAGLIRLQVGGESGVQEILNAYQKGITTEQIITAVELARDSGLLSMYINFIIGGAHETVETFNTTQNFAIDLLKRAPGCVSIGNSFYTPYPDTPMNDNPEQFDIEILDEEVVTGFGDRHVFCRTKALSKFEILELGHTFNINIAKTMLELAKQLPSELIDKHFKAFYKHELSSEWFDCLSTLSSVENYHRSIYKAKGKRFCSIKNKNLDEYYPIRTVSLVSSSENKYLIPLYNGSVLQLDELESMLIDLSTGKLNYKEIFEIVMDNFNDTSSESLQKAIIDRYTNFDKNYLAVWKSNIN